MAPARLPGKALAEIDGVPMVVRVWRQACQARLVERVIVATDDERIAAAVRAAGGEAMMTSAAIRAAPIGSRRSRERIERGDLFERAGRSAVHRARGSRRAGRADARRSIDRDGDAGDADHTEQEWRNPNVVKVVCDARGDALYFSRSPIPFPRDGGVPAHALRHIGVYGYRRDFLLQFRGAWSPACSNESRSWNRLRAIERG